MDFRMNLRYQLLAFSSQLPHPPRLGSQGGMTVILVCQMDHQGHHDAKKRSSWGWAGGLTANG
jgi:hypothetical protein